MSREHFVTLFDSTYLLQGLALYDSIDAQGGDFDLWVVCVDEAVEACLNRLELPHLKTIPVRELEWFHSELLNVKACRTRVEYCWTLTAFSMEAVLRREPTATRVTYVDADVYLFGPPSRILRQLDASGAAVLLTDHARSAERERLQRSGRFCVQFLPCVNCPAGLEIVRWWQKRCLEWCYARFEDGRFGDQKYLEEWPVKWGHAVTVLSDTRLTLAPWNVEHLRGQGVPECLFHFHGLRVFRGGVVRMWRNYAISESSHEAIYGPYITKLREVARRLAAHGIAPSVPDIPPAACVRERPVFTMGSSTEAWTRL
jgi:hypothetical protein